MSPLRARVENGRILLDQPTTLKEGTVIDLVVDDDGDDLSDEERKVLHGALAESLRSADSGVGRAASEVIKELRKER